MSDVIIKNIYKSFGKKEVLKNINLTVDKGQIYGLIGPSGSGKTTIVKIIVGMDNKFKGEVCVLGCSKLNFNLLHDIGYMAQSDALYTDLTGKENLEFFASLFKMSKKEKQERIEYVASLVQLTESLCKKVEAYSGGMKRRLSLAISLVHNPKLLILDEPTVGIDPELRVSIWNELFRLKKEGKTIIVTTHVMDEAEKCDCLSMVRDGKIIVSGSPNNLKNKYDIDTLEEVFLKAGRENA